MVIRPRGLVLACALMALTIAVGAAEARQSFREKLTLLSIGPGPGVPSLVGTGATDIFGPMIERLAVRGTDFPNTSTVPGFAYVYDPKLQVLERSTQLGPVFTERADTVGGGRLEFGASFLFASLQEIDGEDSGLLYGQVFGVDSPDDPDVIGLLEDVEVDSFRLETYVVNMYVTYGITDRWDVNLLVPLAYSEMRVRARRQFSPVLSDGSIGDPLAEAARRSADGDAFGIGDVLVRTKYRLVDAAPLGVASALTIRAPSGAEDDFQGLGDVTVTPALVLSYPFGPHSVHANLGMEFNADDIERTRGRYNIGGAFQLFEHLLFLDQTAFLVEFLGSSGLGDDEFDLPAGNISPANLPPGPGLSHVDLNTIAVDRTDLLDLAAGLKVALPGNGVLYAGAIIPLNDDGVRVKDAIPTGGVEFGF